MSRNKELGTKLRLSTRTISHLPFPNHPTTPPTAAVKFSRIAEKFHSRVEDPFSLVPLRPNEVHKRTKIRFSLPYIIIRLSFPVRSPRFSVVSSPVASFARKENSRGQTHNGYLIFLFQKVSTSRVCGPLTEREREREPIYDDIPRILGGSRALEKSPWRSRGGSIVLAFPSATNRSTGFRS